MSDHASFSTFLQQAKLTPLCVTFHLRFHRPECSSTSGPNGLLLTSFIHLLKCHLSEAFLITLFNIAAHTLSLPPYAFSQNYFIPLHLPSSVYLTYLISFSVSPLLLERKYFVCFIPSWGAHRIVPSVLQLLNKNFFKK